MSRGLVKFVDRLGREKWGQLEQVKDWQRTDMGMKNNFADLSYEERGRWVDKLTQSGTSLEGIEKEAGIHKSTL